MSLTLTDVRLVYPDGDRELVALDEVSLHVPDGTLTAVVGPSGSGKSSLLAAAATLVRPQAGRILVGDTDAGALSDAARTRLRLNRVGIVFQQPNLLPSLTAVEQLQVTDRMRGGASRPDHAERLLATVGLKDRLRSRPHQLSGGERQRVNIARALMGAPEVLLVDEPTSALDEHRGAQIVDLLADLTRHRGLATVLVTHDSRHLDRADRVAVMHDGRLTPP